MSLQVAASGRGPDLVLVHGWGLGRDVWNSVLPALDEHFTVHRVSLPGYDGSAVDTRDFDATAELLADHLPAGATLCGWSMGGMLAQAATALRPERFRRLVLIDTSPKFIQAVDWPDAQPASNHETFTCAVMKAPQATLTRFVMLFNHGDDKAREVSRRLAPLLAADMPANEVLEKGLDWLRDIDLRGNAAAITAPTLVFHGDADPLMPLTAGEWLARTLPHARLERCPGAAHAPFVSDPDHFVAALVAFGLST